MNELAQIARDLEATKSEDPNEWTVLVRNKKWMAVYRDDTPQGAFQKAITQYHEDHMPEEAKAITI